MAKPEIIQDIINIESEVQNQSNTKEPTIVAGTTSQYWRGDKTWQTLPTPDLSAYAPLASPALTGNPTVPTASVGDSGTTIASTAFVNAEILNDVGVANSSLIKTALNASGNANIYACRAWVAFNAATSTILGSGGVSSVSFGGASNTVNLSIAMADTNYAVNYTCQQVNNSSSNGGDTTNGTVNDRSTTTISLYSNTGGHNNSYSQGVTSPYNAVSVFR